MQNFLVSSNDAVIPLDQSHAPCPVDKDGLCPLSTVLPILQRRIQEIDFNYDCYGLYNATAGMNYNGRAPRM